MAAIFSPEQESAIFKILFLALMLNLVPDYMCLLETRWILRRVAQAGIKGLIVLLVLDVIITGGIFACGIGIVRLVLGLVLFVRSLKYRHKASLFIRSCWQSGDGFA